MRRGDKAADIGLQFALHADVVRHGNTQPGRNDNGSRHDRQSANFRHCPGDPPRGLPHEPALRPFPGVAKFPQRSRRQLRGSGDSFRWQSPPANQCTSMRRRSFDPQNAAGCLSICRKASSRCAPWRHRKHASRRLRRASDDALELRAARPRPSSLPGDAGASLRRSRSARPETATTRQRPRPRRRSPTATCRATEELLQLVGQHATSGGQVFGLRGLLHEVEDGRRRASFPGGCMRQRRDARRDYVRHAVLLRRSG